MEYKKNTAKYGAVQHEVMSLDEIGGHEDYSNARYVDWTEPGLKFTRIRLLSDPGFPVWDVSYAYGMVNGEKVRVSLPFSQIPKGNFRKFLYREAKKNKLFLTPTRFFEALSTLQ
jgi:hypothetical protein